MLHSILESELFAHLLFRAACQGGFVQHPVGVNNVDLTSKFPSRHIHSEVMGKIQWLMFK